MKLHPAHDKLISIANLVNDYDERWSIDHLGCQVYKQVNILKRKNKEQLHLLSEIEVKLFRLLDSTPMKGHAHDSLNAIEYLEGVIFEYQNQIANLNGVTETLKPETRTRYQVQWDDGSVMMVWGHNKEEAIESALDRMASIGKRTDKLKGVQVESL